MRTGGPLKTLTDSTDLIIVWLWFKIICCSGSELRFYDERTFL